MMAAHGVHGGLKGRLPFIKPNSKPKAVPSPVDQKVDDASKAEGTDATMPPIVNTEEADKLPPPPSPSEEDDGPIISKDVILDTGGPTFTETPQIMPADFPVLSTVAPCNERQTFGGRLNSLWRRGSDDEKRDASPTTEKTRTARWFLQRRSEQEDGTSPSNMDEEARVGPKLAKRSASFTRRKPSMTSSSSSASDDVLTAGKIVHNPEREYERKRKYDERMARARAMKRLDQDASVVAANSADMEYPDDEKGLTRDDRDGLSSVHEECESELSEEEHDASAGRVSEETYVRRDGRWYDMDGKEFKPKRVIRLVWK